MLAATTDRPRRPLSRNRFVRGQLMFEETKEQLTHLQERLELLRRRL